MNNLKTIYAQNSQCLVREIGDGVVIMPPEGEVTHTLGTLESFIWNQFTGKNDQQTILTAILEEYDVSEEMAREDLLSFSAQLLTEGLIQEV